MRNEFLAAISRVGVKGTKYTINIDSAVKTALNAWNKTYTDEATGITIAVGQAAGTGSLSTSNKNGLYYFKTSNQTTQGALCIYTSSPQQVISRATAQIYNSDETVVFEDADRPIGLEDSKAAAFDNKTPVGGVLTIWMYNDPTRPDSWSVGSAND